jgi:CheY-like chemotaxis protein
MGHKPTDILIVEDHADSASMLSRLLSSMRPGSRTTICKTCAEAIEAVRKHHFDLLIGDIMLPDGDGCDLLVKLRAVYPIPAIAATARAMPDDIKRYRQHGFNDVVIKPYSIDAILASIERVIETTTKNEDDPER